MAGRKKRGFLKNLLLFVVAVIVLGYAVGMLTTGRGRLAREEPATSAPGASQRAATPAETDTPRVGEPFSATGTLRIDEATEMRIILWEVPFGGTRTSRGRKVAELPHNTPVTVTRRAWHADEERYYYFVGDGASGIGWVPDRVIVIDEG